MFTIAIVIKIIVSSRQGLINLLHHSFDLLITSFGANSGDMNISLTDLADCGESDDYRGDYGEYCDIDDIDIDIDDGE